MTQARQDRPAPVAGQLVEKCLRPAYPVFRGRQPDEQCGDPRTVLGFLEPGRARDELGTECRGVRELGDASKRQEGAHQAGRGLPEPGGESRLPDEPEQVPFQRLEFRLAVDPVAHERPVAEAHGDLPRGLVDRGSCRSPGLEEARLGHGASRLLELLFGEAELHDDVRRVPAPAHSA